MKKWKWIVTATAAAALIATWASYGYGTRYCLALKAGNILKEPKDRILIDCAEFWFNRYQSLLGNALTAAVAAITLIWISRQFTVTYKQTAAIAAQTLRIRAGELYEENRGILADVPVESWIEYPGKAEIDGVSRIYALPALRSRVLKEQRNVKALMLFCLRERSKSQHADRDASYTDLGNRCSCAMNEMDRFLTCLADDKQGQSASSIDYEFASSAVSAAMQEVNASRVAVVYKINMELIKTWRAIRKYEQVATS